MRQVKALGNFLLQHHYPTDSKTVLIDYQLISLFKHKKPPSKNLVMLKYDVFTIKRL
jgi:hypothetical protein